jgi:hypothetical protein
LIAYLAGASAESAFASTAPYFLKGLRDNGYLDGRDFEMTYRFADGYLERLPELADEVVPIEAGCHSGTRYRTGSCSQACYCDYPNRLPTP